MQNVNVKEDVFDIEVELDGVQYIGRIVVINESHDEVLDGEAWGSYFYDKQRYEHTAYEGRCIVSEDGMQSGKVVGIDELNNDTFNELIDCI